MSGKNISRRDFVKKAGVSAAALGAAGLISAQGKDRTFPGAMKSEEVVRLLNDDMTGEIEAILTYMRNAFVSKHMTTLHEMEEIGKDEMRHAEWLAQLVTDFGGIPTMEHRELSFGGKTEVDFLKRAIELEKRAIQQYSDHIQHIDHKKVVEVLEVILWEEKRHQADFKEILEEMPETQ